MNPEEEALIQSNEQVSNHSDEDEQVIDIEQFELSTESEGDEGNDVMPSDINLPRWTKIVIGIIRFAKFIMYLAFLTLFIQGFGQIYILNSSLINTILKITWGCNSIILLVNIVTNFKDFVIDLGFFNRASGFVKFNNILKVITCFIFYGSSALLLILILSPIDNMIYNYYLIIIIYYGVDYCVTVLLMVLFIVLCRLGIGVEFAGLILNFMSNVPLRTGAWDEELKKLKEYRLIKDKDGIIKLYDIIEDKEITGYDSDQCVICHEDYKNGESMRYFDCTHYYHKECCDSWLKMSKTCPMCRKEIIFK